jgi:phosphatidylglycerol---prolipoprotein diacylglyceryl transferase
LDWIILSINIFSLLIGIGAAVGLIWVAYRSPEKLALRYMDAGIAALLGALIGGRAVYVVVNWGYFQEHLVEIPEVWMGGISGLGALAGSILALSLLAIFVNQAVGELGDALLPLAATMTSAAWMGCWMDGCAYGAPVDAWWGLQARDEWGIPLPRVPVQLIGALLTLGLFWSLEQISERLPIAGQAAGLALLGLSLELFGLSLLRADPIPTWRGMRLDTWGALSLVCLAALFLAYTLIRMWLISRKRKRKMIRAKAYEGS